VTHCAWCLARFDEYERAFRNSSPDNEKSYYHKKMLKHRFDTHDLQTCPYAVAKCLAWFPTSFCWNDDWDNTATIKFCHFQTALEFAATDLQDYMLIAHLLDREVERNNESEKKKREEYRNKVLNDSKLCFLLLLIEYWEIFHEYVEKMKCIEEEHDSEQSAAHIKMKTDLMKTDLLIQEDKIVSYVAATKKCFPEEYTVFHAKIVTTNKNVFGVLSQQLDDMFELATDFIASLNKEADALKPKPATPKPSNTVVSLADKVTNLSIDEEGFTTVVSRGKKLYQRIFNPCKFITTDKCQAEDEAKAKFQSRNSRCCLRAHIDQLIPCRHEKNRDGCSRRCVNDQCKTPNLRKCTYFFLKPGDTDKTMVRCCSGVHVNKKKNPDMIWCGEDTVIATPENIERSFALKEEESDRLIASAETRRINSEKAEEKKQLSKKTAFRQSEDSATSPTREEQKDDNEFCQDREAAKALKMKNKKADKEFFNDPKAAAIARSINASTARNTNNQKAKNELRKKSEAAELENAIRVAAPLKVRYESNPDTTILTRDQKEIMKAAGYSEIVKKCDENENTMYCSACNFELNKRHGYCQECDPDDFRDELEQAIEAAAPLKARFESNPDTTILTRDEKKIMKAAGYSKIVKKCDENASSHDKL
jgi:hypothetical protein